MCVVTVLSSSLGLAGAPRALASMVIKETTPGAYWLLSVTYRVRLCADENSVAQAVVHASLSVSLVICSIFHVNDREAEVASAGGGLTLADAVIGTRESL